MLKIMYQDLLNHLGKETNDMDNENTSKHGTTKQHELTEI